MRHTYRKITIGCLAAFLLVSSSCNNFLELEPKSNLEDGEFWKTNTDANLGVISIYDAMQATYNNKFFLWGDFRTDNFVSTSQSSGNVRDLLNNSVLSNNADALRWNDFYTVIGRANLAIEKIPTIPLYNPTYLSEAYAARAFAYFDGVRVWGSIPLITKPIVSPREEVSRPRTDGAVIINEQVLPDIKMALETGLLARSTNRFSISSVLALRANVYCYLKQWDKALADLNAIQVLSGNAYRLANSRIEWRNLFLNDPSATIGQFEVGDELMFQLKYNFAEDGRNSARAWALFNPPTPQLYYSKLLDDKWTARFPVTKVAWEAKYGVGSIPPTVIAPIPPATTPTYIYGDYRFLETRTTPAANGVARVLKYSKTTANSRDDDTDLPIYRYSDMVLLKGLVLNRIDFTANKAAAITQINIVRTARQLPPVTAAEVLALNSQDKLETFILDERQFELVCEGKRWWDLIYTDKAITVMNAILPPAQALTQQRLLWPIFFQHLVDNPKLLPQNPGF